MNYEILGNTGIKVSKLCFGSLTLGPLQGRLSIEKGAEVIIRALELGVNFIDTAEYYNTYPYIKKALKEKEGVVIATKSYAYSYQGMEKSIKRALNELGVEQIDIFLLHEQESFLTFKGHRGAFKCLEDAKKKGIIKAIGISTHCVGMVRSAVYIPEIEIIHPIVNFKGLGIKDGTIEEMLKEIKKAYEIGKGIYGMKPLGGGNFISCYDKAMEYVLNIPYLHSIAVGMRTKEEVEANVLKFNGKEIPKSLKAQINNQPRRIIVEEWCTGCRKCKLKCPQAAIKIEDNKAKIDNRSCVLCGYCSVYCPEFCIKII
jgi:predicted aldo/keto reductase-like oxidoreductase